jgi:DNA polymerase type B, organellar and viral
MKRYAHFWWKLTGERCPSRIAVLDCDSEGGQEGNQYGGDVGRLTRWQLVTTSYTRWEISGIHKASGDNAESLWAEISRLLASKEQTWIFMPEARYILSLIGFWELLESGKVELAGKEWRNPIDHEITGEDKRGGVCVLEDPPTLICCKLVNRPGRLLLLDVQNYGIELLAKGESCDNRSEKYARGISAIVSALRTLGGGSLRCTAASQAVQALRSDDACLRLHAHADTTGLALERSAYHGGRCECFRIGDIPGPVYHLDVRSMYAAICRDFPIPVQLRRIYSGKDAKRASESSGGSDMLAFVRVRTEVPAYPLRRGGLTIYPVGSFNTHLCGPELCEAIQRSDITHWRAGAKYLLSPALAPLYTRWLDRLRDERQNGSPIVVQWMKRVLNSLPGKFGETGKRWVPALPRTEEGPYGVWYGDGPDGEPARHRNIAGFAQREEIYGESYWSMPSIAAWITARGRCQLRRYIDTAGRDQVWYVDTDSLLCSQFGLEKLAAAGLIGDGEAGDLRFVEEANSCSVHGIRHYSLAGKITCAGVPKGEIREGESRPEYFARLRIRDEIALGLRPGTGTGGLVQPIPEVYRHGVVGPDGYVSPLRIEDE